MAPVTFVRWSLIIRAGSSRVAGIVKRTRVIRKNAEKARHHSGFVHDHPLSLR
jgi:hypothetical protein